SSRGGSDSPAHSLLHLASPRSGSAAVGQGDPLRLAAQKVYAVTSEWLHLSLKRDLSDLRVVALTHLGVKEDSPSIEGHSRYTLGFDVAFGGVEVSACYDRKQAKAGKSGPD